MDRSYRRIRRLQHRLGGGDCGVPIWEIPPKPPRMHWQTYDRLVVELRHELHRRDGFFDEWIRKREAVLSRLP